MSTTINKLEVIKKDPDLFKKFKKARGRGTWLAASVVLGKDDIDVFLLPVNDLITEKTTHMKITGYSEDSLTVLNKVLDDRAQDLKDRWKFHFDTLNESNDTGWAIDVTKKDYAVLEVGNVDDMHRYQLPWSREGVQDAANFISERSDADLEEDE